MKRRRRATVAAAISPKRATGPRDLERLVAAVSKSPAGHVVNVTARCSRLSGQKWFRVLGVTKRLARMQEIAPATAAEAARI